MLTIKQVQSSDDIYAVRRLLQALTKWVNALEPGSVDSPAFKNVRNELASLPGKFAPPTGRLLLARLSDSAAGCIAYLRIDDTVCELKRMYVDPSFRGQGIGQALVQELLSLAHHNAFERVILASHITMHSAHRVYETNGFRRTLPWDNYSKEYSKKIVFMECDLRINKNKTENLRDE